MTKRTRDKIFRESVADFPWTVHIVMMGVFSMAVTWGVNDPRKWLVWGLSLFVWVLVVFMLTRWHKVKENTEHLLLMKWEDSEKHVRTAYVWDCEAVDVAKSIMLDMPHVDIIVTTDYLGRIRHQWERGFLFDEENG